MANVVTQHQFDNLNNFLSECQKNVRAIEQYSGDDPLALWYQYLQWIDENFSINFKHETIFDHILTTCLCKFEHDERYKQDRRFIKLFIKFIHFQEEQDILYETMVTNGIGSKVADLYVNWAFYFDMKCEYEAAERIFRRGFEAHAAPLPLLKSAHENFGYSMSQNILYEDDVAFQQQKKERMQKRLHEITQLRMNGHRAQSTIKSIALHSFDKVMLQNYCIPFSGAKRMVGAEHTKHNESVAQNIMDSARKMRKSRNQDSKMSGSRLNFSDDDVAGSGTSDCLTLKPKPLPSHQNMYEKGIQIGKNYARVNQPQKVVASRAYVDPEIGTYREEIPAYDKIMLIPATNVAFSLEELKAYRWFKQRGIKNAFTKEQDRFWADGFDVSIRCADFFTRKNFPQTECFLPRIAHYYPNDNGPHKLMCNMSELYPNDCMEEFQLEEIMWRKRMAKLGQLRTDGCSVNANKSVVKSTGRKLNRTNSMESSSKLSPIIEIDDADEGAGVGGDVMEQTLRRRDNIHKKIMAGNEMPDKKRKSSIFSTYDALNDTCTTQMFANSLHRIAISTPNPKIPKYDNADADSTSVRMPEETTKQHPNDRQQFDIYEDTIKMTRDMKRLMDNKHDALSSVTISENKENVFTIENRIKFEQSKLTSSGACRTESKDSGSQNKYEPMIRDQNQQTTCKSLMLSVVQQQQPQQPQPELLPPNAAPFNIYTDESKENLLRSAGSACTKFEISQYISKEYQQSLHKLNETMALILNATNNNADVQNVNQNDCSVFKEPTAIVNSISSTSYRKNNDDLIKSNQSQYNELLDTTEEFEALEAQCASPPVHDVKQTSMKSIASNLRINPTPNDMAMNSTFVAEDKTLVGSPQKSSMLPAEETLNIECARTENQANENHHHNYAGDRYADTDACRDDDDDHNDDIGKSIYVPQTELKFDAKDVDWHEVTVFLECETAEKNEYKVEEVDLNETRHRIDTHLLNMKDLNPFDPELQKDVLTDIGFNTHQYWKLNDGNNFKRTLMYIVKPLKPKSTIEIGQQKYQICKLIGEGAYGKVFTAECNKTKQMYALKQQRPPNLWEYYICLEIHKRIENQYIRNGLMAIDFAVIGNNATIYASKFAKYGTLLDVCQKIKQITHKNIDECIIMILVKQMFTVLDHLHKAKFIHADIKPDNFLLMDKLSLDYTNPEMVVQLIDFGQSIDLNYFSNHAFWAKVRTEHFVCTEMMENKPWTYHCDFFCLASTIYTMVAGKYMIVTRNKSTNSYEPQKLPRYVNVTLWNEIFDQLINIPSLTRFPSLAQLQKRLDTELNAIGSKKIVNAIAKFNKALDQ